VRGGAAFVRWCARYGVAWRGATRRQCSGGGKEIWRDEEGVVAEEGAIRGTELSRLTPIAIVKFIHKTDHRRDPPGGSKIRVRSHMPTLRWSGLCKIRSKASGFKSHKTLRVVVHVHVAAGVTELAGKLQIGYGFRLETDLFRRCIHAVLPMRVVAVIRIAIRTCGASRLKCRVVRRAIPGHAQIHQRETRTHTELLVLVRYSRIGLVVAPNLVIADIRLWEKPEVHAKAVLRQRRRKVLQQELLRALVNR